MTKQLEGQAAIVTEAVTMIVLVDAEVAAAAVETAVVAEAAEAAKAPAVPVAAVVDTATNRSHHRSSG